MENERPYPSSNRPVPSVSMLADLNPSPLNVSFQTGEVFSLDFVKDHGAPRSLTPTTESNGKMSWRAQGCNVMPAYEDLTGILGLRRVESGSDFPSFADDRGHPVENEGFPLTQGIKNKDTGERSAKNLNKFSLPVSVASAMVQPHTTPKSQPTQKTNLSGNLCGTHSEKTKFLCSFGGKILPRPNDGKLRYVGGETRIVSVIKDATLEELMQKTTAIFPQPRVVKYQIPGEDLDALVSVSSDEDLQNMVEEFGGLLGGSQKLRLFLIASSGSENGSFDIGDPQSDPEYQYIVAINNIAESTPRRTSGGKHLDIPAVYHSDNSARDDTGDDSATTTFCGDAPTKMLPRYYHHGNSSIGTTSPMMFFDNHYLHSPSNMSALPSHSTFSPLPSQDNRLEAAQSQTYNNQRCPLFTNWLDESSCAADHMGSMPSSASDQCGLFPENRQVENAQSGSGDFCTESHLPIDKSPMNMQDSGKEVQGFEGPTRSTLRQDTRCIMQDNRKMWPLHAKFEQEGSEFSSSRESHGSDGWISQETPLSNKYVLHDQLSKHYPQEYIDSQVKIRIMQGHVRRPSMDLHPLVDAHSEDDMEGHSFNEPMIQDPAFHSEHLKRPQREAQQQNRRPKNLLSFHHVVPHTLSDSVLQKPLVPYRVLDGFSSPMDYPYSNTLLQSKGKQP